MGALSHQVNLTSALPLAPQRIASVSSNRYQTPSSKERVYLIHEDQQLCQTLCAILTACDMDVTKFCSRADYLQSGQVKEASCFVIDLKQNGCGETNAHQGLASQLCAPVIFISDHPDVAAAVRAMKMGAIEVLARPVDSAVILEAVRAAIVKSRKLRQKQAEMVNLQARYALLSPREKEVVPLIIGGLLNKQAASVLGISLITLQVHKRQVMRKMEAESLADLVRIGMKLRIPYWHGSHSRKAFAIQ